MIRPLAIGLAGLSMTALAIAPAAAGPKTTIRLDVTGCEGCTFVAHAGTWKKLATSTPVVNGKAKISVPRNKTPKLSLEVKHPAGLSGPGATPFVAFDWLRYRNMPGRYGAICWGEQAGASARLDIAVSKWRTRPVPGAPKDLFIKARIASLPAKAFAGVNGTPGCRY